MGSKGEVGETCYTSCETSLYDFLTIQKRLAASEATVLRVGTGGWGMYDYVFWVEYKNSQINVNIIEDDYITVYGRCSGTKTYESIMGASITIPSIDAQKIFFGNN